MTNIQNIKIFLSIAFVSISIQLFAGNVNQGMSITPEDMAESSDDVKTNKKAKLKSKFKRRYKTNETQEKAVKLSQTTLPLTVLCMDCLINNSLINETIQKSHIEPLGLCPLLRTVNGIRKACYKNKKLVLRLIRLTLDPEYKPNLSVIHKNFKEAAFLGDENALDLLIQKGALKKNLIQISATSTITEEIKRLLFPNAISEDQSERCKKLKHNKQIDEMTGKALRVATEKNYFEVVKKLLEHIDPQENVNMIDNGLSYAKNPKMAGLYLTNGAGINEEGDWELTCLDKAVMDGNIEFIDFLIEHGASPLECQSLTMLLDKMEKADPLAAEILVKFTHYSPHNSQNILMRVILYQCVLESTKVQAIAIILKTNLIDINEQGQDGMTALMYASECLLYNVVIMLLANNAKVLLQNHNQQTAIDLVPQSIGLYFTGEESSRLATSIIKLLEKQAYRELTQLIFM